MDHARGEDPQLAAAVTEALRLLESFPPPVPPPSAVDAPGPADQSRAADCERTLSGGARSLFTQPHNLCALDFQA